MVHTYDPTVRGGGKKETDYVNFFLKGNGLGVMTYIYNPSTWEVEAKGSP